MSKFNFISNFFSKLQDKIPEIEIPNIVGKSDQIRLFNTMSGKKEVFYPIRDGKVGLYTCGPTVYSYPHVGNLRTYLFEDFLKRVLQYNDFKVKHVMNITDVGHLTDDQDMGEDKLEKAAKKEHKTAWEIAEFYTKIFKKDLEYLNVIPASIICKATDHIQEQIAMIEELEKKNYVYRTTDGLYFDTSKVSDYTKLSHQNIEALREGARVEKNEEKKNPTDFALWKFSPHATSPSEKRQMEWDSPWGIGFPGWHIECSAMSMRYLGEQFDIHCGGADHINIHHTNEIAQSEAATGKKPWVKYWMHAAFLNFSDGRKVSKSKGDIVTIENVFIKNKISPLVYRFAALNTHYRKPMEWNDDIIETAKNGFDNFIRRVRALGNKIGKIDQSYKDQFLGAINDDLNMSQALAITNEVFKSEIDDEDKLATVLDFDQVLGLQLDKIVNEKPASNKVPESINKLLSDRQAARKTKNWIESDRIRDELLKHGWEVKDTTEGQKAVKI